MIKVDLPVEDGPGFISHVELAVEGDEALFRIVKTSGADYGFVRITRTRLFALIDALHSGE